MNGVYLLKSKELGALGLAADAENNGEFDTDKLGVLQAFCDKNAAYHIVTETSDGLVNWASLANRICYYLATGDKDPGLCSITAAAHAASSGVPMRTEGT